MKFKDIKRKIQTEEYKIPDVLAKIKDKLPLVTIKQPLMKKSNLKHRYAFGFASLVLLLLFVFSSISLPNTYKEISGPTKLNYFNSEAEINNTLAKYNKQKDLYINQQQQLFENYTMADIAINKIYDPSNQTAKTYANKVFYLNIDGLVVYNTSNDKLSHVYQEKLAFDSKTNVKTMYIVNNNLIIIYDNSKFINVIKYDISTMDKLFTYTIASTYINSTLHNNHLYLVSILNDTVLPTIESNNKRIIKSPTDIGYLENVIGDSYTILTSINLVTGEHKETVFLSFDKWDIVYFNHNNLYLINNHKNYKKNLDYGEYTTIVKFKHVPNEGFAYHGSYTIKGSVQDKNNVYEYNNDFRIALEVTHYNVKKIFFFFTKITEVEHSINVINLRSTTVNNNPILELTSNYVISETDDNDAAISILSTKFTQDKVVVESRGIESNITVLDFTDPINIKSESLIRNKTIYSNVIPLDDKYGFSIRTIKTATGEFEIRFFDLSGDSPIEIPSKYAYLNYSYLLKNADYMVLDAINNPNAIYINQDQNNYYIGFNVYNNKNTDGTYTLIKLNKETKECKFQDLSSNNVIIQKLIKTESNELYGLTDDKIVKFKLNQYDNFVKSKYLEIK